MQISYLMYFNEFFTKQIPFTEFQSKIDEYIKTVNPGELTLFCNHIIDDSFVEYDPDMVMLAYLYLWLFPNRLTQQSILTGADNMYLTFIKSVIDSYPEDFKQPLKEIKKTFKTELSKKEINKIVSVKKDIYDLEQPNLFGEELTKAQKSELKKLKAKLDKLESEREDVLNNKVFDCSRRPVG